MDLILGYLLISIILFSANIGLFLGDFKFNNKKITLISIGIGIIFFIVLYISTIFSTNLLDYLAYVFILISIIIFIILLIYLKKDYLVASFLGIIILFYIISAILASQLSELSFFNILMVCIVSVTVMLAAFQLSKLLMYAKRPYNILIGEYMSLMGILIFLFGLTNVAVMNLDYTMFSSFLILTPTNQLIYVIIGIIIVLIIGSYWNDK
jgi:hypothetical protein